MCPSERSNSGGYPGGLKTLGRGQGLGPEGRDLSLWGQGGGLSVSLVPESSKSIHFHSIHPAVQSPFQFSVRFSGFLVDSGSLESRSCSCRFLPPKLSPRLPHRGVQAPTPIHDFLCLPASLSYAEWKVKHRR